MRVALCQIDTTVGDLDGNAQRARQAVERAAAAGSDLAVLPELTLTGYPPRDLLDRTAFVDETRRALERLATSLPREVATLVGFVDRVPGSAPALRNALALVRGGRVEQTFHKRLLPTYDVFDEARYFGRGQLPLTFELAGERVGVTICEDAWNDVDGPLRRAYDDNPVADCAGAGATLLVNAAASPFHLAKRAVRPAMLSAIAANRSVPVAFVNAVGGNDDLIFDGASALYGASGELWARAKSFAEDVVICDVAPGQAVASAPPTDAAAAYEALVCGTGGYARKCGFGSAVLGLSGGIDSSLVAAIAARALGPSHVLGVAMPTRYSSQGSLDDARALAEALGIGFRVIPIDDVFQRYLDVLGPHLEVLGPAGASDTTFETLQARIRGNTLMAISNRFGSLLLTTGNKSEVAVGYCTLYGDMAGGLAVISDLPKTFVYQVAREHDRQAGRQQIPESCYTKAPSAELRPDQKDEDSLPPYAVLDPILERLVEDGQSVQQVVDAGFERPTVERIASMVVRNEYKRRPMPPGLIVTRKAFGPGRRYPLAQRYRP
jgi:NAD+ synthetase